MPDTLIVPPILPYSPLRRPIGKIEVSMAYRLAERLEKTDKRPRRLMITSDQMDITITPIDGNEATPRILLTKWLNSKKRGWFGYKKGFNLEVIDLPSNLSLKIWLDSIDELERYPEPNWWTIGSQKDT